MFLFFLLSLRFLLILFCLLILASHFIFVLTLYWQVIDFEAILQGGTRGLHIVKNTRVFSDGPLNGGEASYGIANERFWRNTNKQNSWDIYYIGSIEMTNYYEKMKIDMHDVSEGLSVTT